MCDVCAFPRIGGKALTPYVCADCDNTLYWSDTSVPVRCPMCARQHMKCLYCDTMVPRVQDVFVFGSNMQGIHGAGSAKYALSNCGAIWGLGKGLQGQSYAIPTKDFKLKPLPLTKIAEFVTEFLAFARDHPELRFNIAAIGCGLAGYTAEQIKPMFTLAPNNCNLPVEFR